MATKHAIVRTDNLSGTIDGSKLISAKFYSGSDPAAIDNGNVVSISDELINRETYKVTAPTAADTRVTIGLVASVEIMYDEQRHHNLEDFTNEADSLIRVYALETGDEFSVTKEALDGTVAKDKYVKLTAGSTKLTATDTATGAIGKIVAVEIVNPDTYYVIKVK